MLMIKCLNYSKKISGMRVLSDISLEIAQGECVGLWGRNASGKTMLLRAFSGLILPDTGSIMVNGQLLTTQNRFPDSLGLIIENMKFWPFMTANEALSVIASIKKKVSKDIIRETLLRVGLDPLDKRTISKFSLGMIQKLSIAQAIMESPNLLLLDEPTNALDEKSRLQFYEIIKSEIKRGATIVMASHSREDLDECCHRIIKIDNGTIKNDK